MRAEAQRCEVFPYIWGDIHSLVARFDILTACHGFHDGLFLWENAMLVSVDYQKFQAKLNAYSPDKPYTVEEATEAFHNLVSLVRLFREVEREVCGRKNLPPPSA
jgi:hypothetical protein